MKYLTSDQVKGYVIQKKIGAGGFGEVYLATETRPNFEREVALKIISPVYANEPRFIQRFESEAQLIARLEYPYIVPLYDYWRDPNGAYLVMRWLKGGSVKDILEKGPLDLATTARIMNQICSALALAHKNGVIHRDLKPGNILLDDEGNAFLSDFGIAKDFLKFDSNTQPEDIIGSPKYISPEQARSEAVTPRTDVYSLGVTLYEMLAGSHPFPNANMYDLIYKHLNETLPLLTTLDDTVQDDINIVIQKATAKNPANRYSDAISFALAFQEAAQIGTFTQAETMEEQLTVREQQLLSLLIQGKSNKEIANELYLALDTVKWHLRNAYKKMGVTRREQAIVVARNLTLVGEDATLIPEDVSSYIIDFEPENPYKGLESFTYADAGNFFGRDNLVDKLLVRLQQDHPHCRFLAVLGPSGSGKSSLTMAGLVPALWEGRMPGSDKWLVADMIPHEHPVDELEIALRSIAAKHAEGLGEMLLLNERGLVKAAQLILPEGDNELLLIIDQFEEVFTLVESEEERLQFMKLIANAVTDSSSRVRIVITIRADYYDRPLYYSQFGDILRDRVETVLPLSAEELQTAIVEPARKVGVKFEDGLVATIISDINYQPGSLPLLQYALTEMFDQRDGRIITRAVYEKIGGASGAIASTAEELFLSYDETGQQTIRQMFLRLVTLGEGAEDTRRRTARDELLSIASDSYLMDDIIDTYAYARMLSLDNDPTTREPTVEVAHEAILREWERLRGWLNDSRDDIKTQRQLASLSVEWELHQRSTDYLVRGTRLDQLQLWSAETSLTLTPSEHAFLDASIAERDRRVAKEQAQAEREANLQQRARRIMQGLVAVFLVAAVVSGLLAFLFNQERDEAEAQTDIAEREAEISRSIALASSAQKALAENDPELALALAMEAYGIEDPPVQARQALANAAYAPGTRHVFDVGVPLSAVAISPDGKIGAIGGGRDWVYEVYRSELDLKENPDLEQDFDIILVNLETGEEIRRLEGHTGSVQDLEFSPDGTKLVSASFDKSVIVWDVETGEPETRFLDHGYPVLSVAITPDSKYVLSGWQLQSRSVTNDEIDNGLLLWDISTGEVIKSLNRQGTVTILKEPQDDMRDITISPDGRLAVTMGHPGLGLLRHNDTAAYLWDLTTGEFAGSFAVDGAGYTAAFSPDGQTVLIGGHAHSPDDPFVQVPLRSIIIQFDVATTSEIRRFYQDGTFVTEIAFTADGKRAVASSLGQRLYVWDLVTGESLLQLGGHEHWLISMALSPDGNQVLTTSVDGTARLWDLNHGAVNHHIITDKGRILAFDISPDGKTLVMGTQRRHIQFMDIESGSIIDEIRISSPAVTGIEYIKDGSQIVYSTSDGNIIIIDSTTYDELQMIRLGFTLERMDVSPDDRYVTFNINEFVWARAVDNNYRTEVWDLETGQRVIRMTGHDIGVGSLEFSPDGEFILTSSNDSTVRLWNIETGEEIFRTDRESTNFWTAVFSPDGRHILTAGGDRSIALWDLETQQPLRFLTGHSESAGELAIDPTGKLALSSGASGLDRSIFLWDLETGQEILRFSSDLLNHHSRIIDFTPDGRFAVSAGITSEIVIWQLDRTEREIIAWAQENRYIRDFTCPERVQFDIQPLCDSTGNPPPARTPYPTLTATLVPSATPTLDATLTTLTPTPSSTPTETPVPTNTPPPPEPVEIGATVSGRFAPGQSSSDYYTFEGVEGQVITLAANSLVASLPVELYDADNNLVTDNSDPVTLPVTGRYTIVVSPAAGSSGNYNLVITEMDE